MSAYVVEDDTINRIVSGFKYAAEYGDGCRQYPQLPRHFAPQLGMGELDFPAIGKILFELNCEAVRQRYEDADDMIPENYSYRSVVPPIALQLYKSLRCLLYQCSEGNIPDTPVYKLLDEFARDIAEYIVMSSPAWEAIRWG